MECTLLNNDFFGKITIIKDLDKCPICHNNIASINLCAYVNGNKLYVMKKCPNTNCNEVFFAEYYNDNIYDPSFDAMYNTSYPKKYVKRNFEKIINDISPSFIIIYNQALQAENLQLDEICGVAYRKALEFLIKDYCICKNPDEGEQIKGKFLGECITKYIDDGNLKNCAKRAAWLGNDETHYVKKWSDRDVKDLKILIELTIHWIINENLTNEYLSEMK